MSNGKVQTGFVVVFFHTRKDFFSQQEKIFFVSYKKRFFSFHNKKMLLHGNVLKKTRFSKDKRMLLEMYCQRQKEYIAAKLHANQKINLCSVKKLWKE